MSNSLQPYGLQHARLPCPSPTPGAHSNSCPLSQWCHPTISSFLVPFSCLQFFPASGSFPTSQFFASLEEHRFYIELVYTHTHTHTHTDNITKSISWELMMDKDDVVYVYICTHTYNGTLLNHKKVWNNAIWSNMDELRDYHTKESKSERQILIPYDIYVESKKWHRWTCLQEKTDLHT